MWKTEVSYKTPVTIHALSQKKKTLYIRVGNDRYRIELHSPPELFPTYLT